MIQIRKTIFETNSSSTHAICIQKDNKNIFIPEELYFHFGEFGWDETAANEPADYLYTAIYYIYKYCEENIRKFEDYKNYIYNTLAKYGCEAEFDDKFYDDEGWIRGYIDHAGELTEFLDKIRHSEKRLIRYLFGNESFILTGNDNDDTFDEMYNDYSKEKDFNKKFEVYFKGN